MATLVEKVPSGGRWIHEVKFDGYRVQLHFVNDDIKVFTRRGNDWTKRFKKIAGEAYLINSGSRVATGRLLCLPRMAAPSSQFCRMNSRASPPKS